MMLVFAAVQAVAVGASAVLATRRERDRLERRRCPACRGRALVRAVARPPRDTRRYQRLATAFRCHGCGIDVFEVARPRFAGPLTGDQIDAWLAASELPTATLRRG